MRRRSSRWSVPFRSSTHPDASDNTDELYLVALLANDDLDVLGGAFIPLPSGELDRKCLVGKVNVCGSAKLSIQRRNERSNLPQNDSAGVLVELLTSLGSDEGIVALNNDLGRGLAVLLDPGRAGMISNNICRPPHAAIREAVLHVVPGRHRSDLGRRGLLSPLMARHADRFLDDFRPNRFPDVSVNGLDMTGNDIRHEPIHEHKLADPRLMG